MSVEPGQMLSHYRLLEKIGQGGMGVVWKATDTKLDREVAIKILPDAFSQDPVRLGRFKREAKAVAALNHPNIVTIHSVEDVDGVQFITMELVQGKPLTSSGPWGPDFLRIRLAGPRTGWLWSISCEALPTYCS